MKVIKVALLLLLFAAGLISAGLFATGQIDTESLETLTYISPRGSMRVLDEFPLWVAQELGYFRELGLEVVFKPGPENAFATTQYVDQRRADIGRPSVQVLLDSVEAGMDITLMYQLFDASFYFLAIAEDSEVQRVEDLRGRIALGDQDWRQTLDPLLSLYGIELHTLQYVSEGPRWEQALVRGEVEAVFGWRGLKALWQAQELSFRYLSFGNLRGIPGAGYCARASDLKDEASRARLIRFFRAVNMALEFTGQNPRATAQIMYSRIPELQEQMYPLLVLETIQQLYYSYTGPKRDGGPLYGAFDPVFWDRYLDSVRGLRPLSRKISSEQLATDRLLIEANFFDSEKVDRDARSFPLKKIWKDLPVKE